MTPDEIEQMKADIEAGTPGPWVRDCWDILGKAPGTGAVAEVCKPNGDDDTFWRSAEPDANARRIARVPELEAEVLRLREALRPISQHYVELDKTTRMRAIGTRIDIEVLRDAHAAFSNGYDNDT